jgi:hypothetical protein
MRGGLRMMYSCNNELVEKVNNLREKLLILNNNYKFNEEIIEMSQKLDIVLVTYYLEHL